MFDYLVPAPCQCIWLQRMSGQFLEADTRVLVSTRASLEFLSREVTTGIILTFVITISIVVVITVIITFVNTVIVTVVIISTVIML